MELRWSPWFGCLVLVLLDASAYAGDSSPRRFTTKVMVTVSADANLQNAVTSCLNRELGSRDGVELAEARADRIISIVAKEIRNVGRSRNGIVLATVFAAPYYYDPNSSRLSKVDRATDLIFGLSQNLYIDSADNLQSMCKEIIEDFDAEQVEPRRKRFSRIK